MKLTLLLLALVAIVLIITGGDGASGWRVPKRLQQQPKTPFKETGFELHPDNRIVVPRTDWRDDANARARTDFYQGLAQVFTLKGINGPTQYSIFYQVNQDHAQPPHKICVTSPFDEDTKPKQRMPFSCADSNTNNNNDADEPQPQVITEHGPCADLLSQVPEVKGGEVMQPDSQCTLKHVVDQVTEVWWTLPQPWADGTREVLVWYENLSSLGQLAYDSIRPVSSLNELSNAFTLPAECEHPTEVAIAYRTTTATNNNKRRFPYRTGLLPHLAHVPRRFNSRFEHTQYDLSALPQTWDWRQEGLVTPVKDQADCGSCWAHAAVATMETAYAKKHGKRVLLSEQQFVDCARNAEHFQSGAMGCMGGLPELAFDYLLQRNTALGLATDDEYGHYLMVNGRCHDQFNATTDHFIRLKAYHQVESSVEAVKAAIYHHGPVTVVIDASPSFQSYEKGVLEAGCSSGQGDGNHAVTVVGWGIEPDQPDKPYWIIKNSWGPWWGNDGYIHIAIEGNVCGVTNTVFVPEVE